MGERLPFSKIESNPMWETATPQGQMDVYQQWEISNTEWLRDNALGVPQYTQAANKFARGAQEIRQSIVNRHAREVLSAIPTVEGRNQVIDAWKNDDITGLSEQQIGALKSLRSFSQENAPLARDYGGLAITPSGPAAMGTPLSKKSEKFVTGTLKRRADSKFEYFIPHPDIDDNHKTMVLDGNVGEAVKSMDARVEQLKKIEKETEARLKDFKPQGMGDAGSVNALVSEHNSAKKEREELEKKLERYGTNTGQIEYVLDQINERVRKAPYIGAMGEGASFETLGGQLDRDTIDTLGSIASGLFIGAAAVGELQSRTAEAVGLEGTGEVLGRGAERARQAAKDMESVTESLKKDLPRMSRLAFRDTFASKVGMGVVNNAPGFVLDMILSGGSSIALRKGISVAARRSMAVMERAGKLKYVDNVFAPMLGTMPGALREGTDAWMEGMQKVEETLGDYPSIEAARADAERLAGAGDSAGAAKATEIANKAQELMDGSNFAFLASIASTSGTDFIPLRRMLKMGNRTAGDMADELIQRVAKDGQGIKDALGKALEGAVIEGSTEAFQGVLNRNWANQFYEANKHLFGEEMGVETAVGAIMGMTANGIIEGVGLRKLQRLNQEREERRVAELKDIEAIDRARNEIIETPDGKFTTKDENFTEEFLTREEAEAFAQTRFRERFFNEARKAFKDRGHSDEKIDKMERTLRVLAAKAAQRAGESEDAFFEHVKLKDLGIDEETGEVEPPPEPEPDPEEGTDAKEGDFDFENDPDINRDPLAVRNEDGEIDLGDAEVTVEAAPEIGAGFSKIILGTGEQVTGPTEEMEAKAKEINDAERDRIAIKDLASKETEFESAVEEMPIAIDIQSGATPKVKLGVMRKILSSLEMASRGIIYRNQHRGIKALMNVARKRLSDLDVGEGKATAEINDKIQRQLDGMESQLKPPKPAPEPIPEGEVRVEEAADGKGFVLKIDDATITSDSRAELEEKAEEINKDVRRGKAIREVADRDEAFDAVTQRMPSKFQIDPDAAPVNKIKQLSELRFALNDLNEGVDFTPENKEGIIGILEAADGLLEHFNLGKGKKTNEIKNEIVFEIDKARKRASKLDDPEPTAETEQEVDPIHIALDAGLKPKHAVAIFQYIKGVERGEKGVTLSALEHKLTAVGLTKKQARAIKGSTSIEEALDAAIDNKPELARKKAELGLPNLVRGLGINFEVGVEPLSNGTNAAEFDLMDNSKLGDHFYRHIIKTHGKLLARLDELGVQIAIGSSNKDFQEKLGENAAPSAYGWATTNFEGKPIIGIQDNAIAVVRRVRGDAEAMRVLKTTLEHEAVHAAEYIFSKRYPSLFKKAKNIFNKRSKDYDAEFDAFMSKEYPGWETRLLANKTHEGIRAIVEGRWTGTTSGHGGSWGPYVSKFIEFVRALFGNGEIRHDSIVALAQGTERVLGVKEGALLKKIDQDVLLNPEVAGPIKLGRTETPILTREESRKNILEFESERELFDSGGTGGIDATPATMTLRQLRAINPLPRSEEAVSERGELPADVKSMREPIAIGIDNGKVEVNDGTHRVSNFLQSGMDLDTEIPVTVTPNFIERGGMKLLREEFGSLEPSDRQDSATPAPEEDAEATEEGPEPTRSIEQQGREGNRARVETFADTQEVLITLMSDADLSSFANSMFAALGLVKNTHGVSFLDAALGGRRDKFLEWAESAGKADETIDTEKDEKKQKPAPTSFGQLSPEGMQKAATGFERFIKTGKSPVAGLDAEFEILSDMMEELYRGTADVAGLDLTDKAMFPFNSLFLDDTQRQSVGELKQGEVRANLPGYVRIATKTGKPQKGFKEYFQVEAFRNKQKTPEGRRMKVEHENGRFYLIQPITTPEVQRAQNIVERANRGDTVTVKRNEKGQKVQRLPSREAIATTASRANGFMGVDLIQNFVGKLPLIGATWKRAETGILRAVQRWQETSYSAKNIANAEGSLLKEMPAQYDPRTEEIVDVVPLAGGSRHWHDVFSSVARGEDNYLITDELRDYIFDYRNKVKDVVRMMHEEGVDLEWLQRGQDGEIDWANSGIPGYIPRITKPNKDRTKKQNWAVDVMQRRINEGRGDQELTPRERKAVKIIESMNQGEGILFGPPTKSPKSKRGFERARKFRGSQGGQDSFDAGFRHPDPVESMRHFLRDTYQRVADHRFFVDEEASDRIIDATKSLPYSHSNQARVAEKGGFKILFDTIAEQEEFSRVFTRNYEAAEDGKIMKVTQFGKGLLAGLDFSTSYIFGHITMMANPAAWAKATAKQFEAFLNEDAFINLVSKPDKQITYKDSARLGVQYGHQAEFTKGLEGKFFNRATLGLSGRFAHGHKGFLDASSFFLWESMTMHMPRDANGNITAAFETEARAVADFINRATGKNDFARYGAKQRHITVGRALMFAPQMYAGFTNMYLSMASSGTEGKLARRAMSKYLLGMTTAYIAMGLASGLDWEEIKDRLNPTSGAFMTLPFENQTGAIKEIGLGGFTRSMMKMIGQSAGAVLGLTDVGPESLKNDKDVIDPFIEFMRARVAPGISTGVNLIRGKNYFGEPVPPEENFINGFVPIWMQDWAKWRTRDLYDALSETTGSKSYWHEHRIFLPDNPTTRTTVEDAVKQFLGLNVYSQSMSRNFRTRMERMARDKFNMEYEELNPAQMVEINREINELPIFQDDSKSTLESKEKRRRSVGQSAEQMERNKSAVRKKMDGANLKKMSELGVTIPAVDMVMNYGGEQYVLSIKQIKELREAYAREFDDALRKVELIPRWSEYSVEYRKDQMQKALNEAAKRARRFIDKPVDGE